MTTSRSPIEDLRRQAETTAKILKLASTGARMPNDRGGRIAAAQASDRITFAVVMDDKVLQVEMLWSVIRASDEAAIAELILDAMRGEHRTVQ